MSDIASKLVAVAEKVPAVYNAGKKAEHDAFWDEYQQNGTLTNYSCAFAGRGWTEETFKPKHKIKPDNAYMMFGQQSGAIIHQSNCSTEIDFSNCANMQYAFYTNDNVLTLGVIDASKARIITGLFGNSKNLQSVQGLIFSSATGTNSSSAGNPFQNCNSLTHIIFSGTVACNEITLEWSTGLDRESIESIINSLSQTTSGKKITLSLTAVQAAFGQDVTSDTSEWKQFISKRSNWTIILK